MGFLDKVKDTANKAADQAKHATAVGKEKLEDRNLQKKMNDLLQEIGALGRRAAPQRGARRRGHPHRREGRRDRGDRGADGGEQRRRRGRRGLSGSLEARRTRARRRPAPRPSSASPSA